MKLVEACDDIQAVKNVAQILLEGMETGVNADVLLRTLKEAYSELADCHYTEELARLYYSANGIDATIWDTGKQTYTPEVQASYREVTLFDWLVLFGRMSQNTKGTEAIVEACKVFLDNKFLPYNID